MIEKFCPADAVVEVIGNKGALQILRALFGGPKRTLELLDWMEISSKTLSDRLKELEKSGVISRRSYPESPPRVEYSLTEKGEELRPVLEAMREVGERWNLRHCDSVAPDIAAKICGTCTLYRVPVRHRSMAAGSIPEAPVIDRKKQNVTLL